jgi:rhamnogalacturonyl hydrolase YesR
MQMSEMVESVKKSICRVEEWVKEHKCKGYEPFDGLSSYLKPLTCGNLLLDRLLMQLIRQSPINLRPLLGVKPLESTKGRGYMAWGYLTMLRVTSDAQYRGKAVECLEWLMENKSPKYASYTWANHFDFASRGGRYPKHEPIIVWTALIGQTFLDAYELLREEKYLRVAASACDWILTLPREKTASGTCIGYHALHQESVHNSSMLGAALLARTSKFTKNAEALKVAREAMEYSCLRQLKNGAWYYGEDPQYHWIDNFHTGYNLDSLKCYLENTNDETYEENLRRGLEYFINNFFEENGRPKYYHNRAYPIDIQCVSQSLDTLSNFSDYHKSALVLGQKVARWAIDNMQDKEGYFYYRQYPLMTAKTPMLHWGQATMYKGLTSLLSKLAQRAEAN